MTYSIRHIIPYPPTKVSKEFRVHNFAQGRTGQKKGQGHGHGHGHGTRDTGHGTRDRTPDMDIHPAKSGDVPYTMVLLLCKNHNFF